jgi:hypothetical protein
MWLLVLQRTALEFLWHIIYVPVWWYTAGAAHAARVCADIFLSGNDQFAPLLWLKNLFVPMYGLADWQGRIISVFIRFVNVIVRTVFVFLWSLWAIALFLVWLAAPVVVAVMILQTR